MEEVIVEVEAEEEEREETEVVEEIEVEEEVKIELHNKPQKVDRKQPTELISKISKNYLNELKLI